jgi:hypothetical protein
LKRCISLLASLLIAASLLTPGLVLLSAAQPAAADGGTCAEGYTDASQTWFFAEGYTGDGFQEWLCLLNPQDQISSIDLNLLFVSGDSQLVELDLPPQSRTTLYINAYAGAGMEVSLSLESELPILAERPMYFTYHGEWKGCTTSTGVTSLSDNWYFAEGCTREGFEEWMLLANPGNEECMVDFLFILEDGSEIRISVQLPQRSRRTANINQLIGEGHDVSAHIFSDKPICAERVMYFNYHGMWPGGHVSTGFNQPQTTYLFAEGYTGAGFEEWLSLIPITDNPSGFFDIDVKCLFSDGGEETHRMRLETEWRHTININQLIGGGKEVSLELTSTDPFLAERVMYFNYNGHCRGGHVSKGAENPGTVWQLAEGTTRPGFDTYLCLMNPGDQDALAEVDFICTSAYNSSAAWYIPPHKVETRDFVVPSHSRLTINVEEQVGMSQDTSFEVRSDKPIVVERPLYNPGTDFNVDNAMEHLWNLSVVIGERIEGTEGELIAANYLMGVLESYGYESWIQEVPLPNGSVTRNVIADLETGGGGETLIIGGHYDTKIGTGSPGANDNASGTVVTLELARCFAERPVRPDLRFIFFGGEERLVDNTDYHHFGSRYYVANMTQQEKEDLIGAIIIDMVGVGWQLYARTMGIGPMDLCNELMAYAAGVGISLPYMKSGSYSDHEPFELAGIPAVWLEYKDDPWYHTVQDTYDKIVPGFIDNTGRLLEGFIRNYDTGSEPPTPPP